MRKIPQRNHAGLPRLVGSILRGRHAGLPLRSLRQPHTSVNFRLLRLGAGFRDLALGHREFEARHAIAPSRRSKSLEKSVNEFPYLVSIREYSRSFVANITFPQAPYIRAEAES